MSTTQTSPRYKATYGNNIYKSGNRYRVRVSVNGTRLDEYVPTLTAARSLRKTWKNAQKEASNG